MFISLKISKTAHKAIATSTSAVLMYHDYPTAHVFYTGRRLR